MKRTLAATPILLHGHEKGLLAIGIDYKRRLKVIRCQGGWRAYRALRIARMRPLSDMEVAALPQEVRDTLTAYRRAQVIYERSQWVQTLAERDQAWQELGLRAAARDHVIRAYAAELTAWHRSVCSPECKATAENGWNVLGEDRP